MSRAKLLREAGRLGVLASESHGAHIAVPRLAAALQGALGVHQATPLLRPFSGSSTRNAEEEQVKQQEQQLAQRPQYQKQQKQDAGGGGRAMRNGGRRHGAGGGEADARRRIYIPPQWEQQGWQDRDLPLIQDMLRHIEAGDAWEARRAFDAMLAQLEEAVGRGEQPPPELVPPPYAWKLYMAVLPATGCHAHRMSSVLGLMQSLGVPPQSACYVVALRQMARQGIGHPAYTTINQMKDLRIPPTLRCYMFAIEANLRAQPPEHNFAKKLFDEVAVLQLAVHPAQKAELGKLLMQATRDFARHYRFNHASTMLDYLEGLGLRVPAFLVSDVLQLAAAAGDVGALHRCVQRLQAATSTFQEIPGEGEPVMRPLKVEEGLLLSVLEVAANKGSVELAEAAWQLLERSLALPNPPSTGGALNTHLTKARELQRLEEQAAAASDAAAASEAGDGEAGGEAGAAEGGAGGGESAKLEALNAELEAYDSAAAEVAEQAAARKARRDGGRGGGKGDPAQPSSAEWSQLAVEEARAMAAAPRGVRTPSMLSHLARVHAYAKAGAVECMFEAVADVEKAFPDDPDATSYHHSLPMCVDALASSVRGCDDAFFLLERCAEEGRPVSTAQLNLVVAAYCQMGDLKRAFETFDAYEHLGVAHNTDTYNALMQGCIECGRVDTGLKVFEQLQEAEGLEPNAATHHHLVDACVVAGDVESMMDGLAAMDAAGHSPKLWLMERCVARAERAGDQEAVKALMIRLFKNDYRIVGVDAKWRRWQPEGGMQMLTGSSLWFSREEVLREMRKGHSINSRISRRSTAEQQQQQQQGQQEQEQRHQQEQQQ